MIYPVKLFSDPTNAVRRDDAGIRSHDVETSTGEMIQSWAPGSMVVKAFNTLGAATMADPASAGGPMTIPIAGNNASAKARIAELVTGIGFDVVDMGDISAAHAIEQMADRTRKRGCFGDHHSTTIFGQYQKISAYKSICFFVYFRFGFCTSRSPVRQSRSERRV